MKNFANVIQHDYVQIFFLPTYQSLSWYFVSAMYLIFPAFWSHCILLKIVLYTKKNPRVYNLGMGGKKIVVTVNYDVIGI